MKRELQDLQVRITGVQKSIKAVVDSVTNISTAHDDFVKSFTDHVLTAMKTLEDRIAALEAKSN